MSSQRPDWWDWIELNKPIHEPMRLKDDAPEDVKRKFEEWQKRKAEERAQHIYK